jgi:shikimate dehydrogenase
MDPMTRSPAQALDGSAMLFATLADPVAQVRLPQVMAAVFQALGVNAAWVPMHVPPDALPAALAALRAIPNFAGITVSIPHKPALAASVDRLSRRALASGGANLARRDPDGALCGDMVDGAGFVRGLELQGLAVAGAAAWVVGAGGAGAAIATSLAESGAERVYLTEADPRRAEAVAERMRHHYPGTRVEVVAAPPGRLDLAINATPLGLRACDPLPFDPGRLDPAATVCDIVMKPRETALLIRARELGLRVHHGHHMLDAQVPMYLDFLGIPVADEARVVAIARGLA